MMRVSYDDYRAALDRAAEAEAEHARLAMELERLRRERDALEREVAQQEYERDEARRQHEHISRGYDAVRADRDYHCDRAVRAELGRMEAVSQRDLAMTWGHVEYVRAEAWRAEVDRLRTQLATARAEARREALEEAARECEKYSGNGVLCAARIRALSPAREPVPAEPVAEMEARGEIATFPRDRTPVRIAEPAAPRPIAVGERVRVTADGVHDGEFVGRCGDVEQVAHIAGRDQVLVEFDDGGLAWVAAVERVEAAPEEAPHAVGDCWEGPRGDLRAVKRVHGSLLVFDDGAREAASLARLGWRRVSCAEEAPHACSVCMSGECRACRGACRVPAVCGDCMEVDRG